MKDFFPFENANWPALLVEEAGTIRRANKAAAQVFGGVVETDSSLLSALWSNENPISAEKFLGSPERSASTSLTLKLKAKGGGTNAFNAYVCPLTRDGTKYLLFQLFKEGAATPSLNGPTKAADSTTVDANLAHKQKLDCALQLARTVALDFNNALTSVLGHASLLLSKADPDHAWRGSLVEIEKSAAKAAEIAADLAAFSRQEKETKTQATGSLNPLLERTVDLFRKPEYGRVQFALHLESKPFGVKFDEAKIQQAFVKILENAVDAVTENGQVSIETRNMETSTETQDRSVKLSAGTYVCVVISDNGEGIAPDILPRIFEPFFTTKEKPHRGLGLAFAYGIITNHGGAIAVSSEPGLGTSVRIYLPATKRVIKAASFDANDLFGIETILMVDDEDLLLNMGQMVLSSFGYRVLTANSGQDALKILKDGEPIDLVITDLVMPHMSGRELIEKIHELSPGMRILCTSGYVRGQNVEEESGYLQKPFTSQELLTKVKQSLT